ncbi:MAG: glycerol-3-phosphate 1-O-acyltransferase PlsY [Phycisphaerae bacterium]
MEISAQLVFFALAAYAIGSTPFGVIIAAAHGRDIRKEGSGNVGATNVGRVLGGKWGYLCFLLDTAKGFVPTFTAVMLAGAQNGLPTPAQQAVWLLTGMGAILGHVFSLWLKLRGGKGVATALGVVLGIWPYFTYAGLAALGLWIAVTLTTRYVSVGSITAACAFVPLLVVFNWPPSRIGALWPLAAFAGAMSLLIIVRHRANVRRLLAGTENRIGHPKT